MRHYTPDSPEAMARIVAIALLADGGLDKSEIESLEKDAVVENLNLSSEAFDKVVQDFCDDLLSTSLRDASGQIGLGRETIDHLLADIQTPELQMRLLRILLDLVNADGRLTPGEATLISQAMTRWGLELDDKALH